MKRVPMIALAFCSQSAQACSAGQDAPASKVQGAGTVVEAPGARGKAVAGLPDSEGRVFYSLDEYLAFLRKAGEYDAAWYRRVGPDEYELVARRIPGSPPPKRVTRDELMRKFGFDR